MNELVCVYTPPPNVCTLRKLKAQTPTKFVNDLGLHLENLEKQKWASNEKNLNAGAKEKLWIISIKFNWLVGKTWFQPTNFGWNLYFQFCVCKDTLPAQHQLVWEGRRRKEYTQAPDTDTYALYHILEYSQSHSIARPLWRFG